MIPYSESLKNTQLDSLIERAHRSIPPGIRERLSIKIMLKYPTPIGFLLANNAFGRMSLEEKHKEEAICFCERFDEYKSFRDCDHVITTDPEILKGQFPTLHHLCKKGCKYRAQTKQITETMIFNAINSFGDRMERKHGNGGNELMSWRYTLKTLIKPYLKDLPNDKIYN